LQSGSNEYVLGSDEAEHERLIRQAAWLITHTERFLRRAGLGRGQRVLDLGSGVGDVTLIAAQLVGSTGEVVGAERDPRAIAKAVARMTALGLHHVRFTQIDISALSLDEPFDAVIGRYILFFLREPAAVLHDVWRLVRPGGIVAFQEPHWTSFLAACEGLPLWRASAELMVETFRRTGANVQIGADLAATFQRAGLPEPEISTDTLIGAERWMPDVLHSIAPQIATVGLSLAPVGDLNTLYDRLVAEAAAHNASVPVPALRGAWVRKPVPHEVPE